MEVLILKTYASLQLLPAILVQRWWLVLLIFVAVALFGRRVYCRFICPLGIAQDLVRGFVGKRRICSRLDQSAVADVPRAKRAASAMATGVRHALPQLVVRLVILTAFVAAGQMGLGWQWLDPCAIASRAACWFTSPEFDWPVALFALVPAALILLLAIFFGGRIWCNWICPVGTLLALVGIKPLKGDKVKKCTGCDKCRRCFK